MTSVSLDRLAHALGVNDEREHDSHSFATVMSINQDGSYQVAFNGSTSSTRAAKCCNAAAGDRVLCLISHGQVSAIGRVGGDVGKMPTVLYDNPSGNNGNITLSESVANYDYVRVYFWCNAQHSSSDVYKPNGKDVSLMAVRSASASSSFHYGGATYHFNGTSLTLSTTGIADSNGGWSGRASTYIYRVEAWSDGASVGFGTYVDGGGSGGTANYNELTNKPTITEPVYGTDRYSTVTIQGNKTFDELGMHPFSELEIESLLTAADA